MHQIEGADGSSCDVTMREIISSDSDGNYGKLKDTDVLTFYMGKSTPGNELLNTDFFIYHFYTKMWRCKHPFWPTYVEIKYMCMYLPA